MTKLRIFYIISLVILGVLVVLTVFRPMAEGDKYSMVQYEGIIQTEDRWIIEIDILNHEGKEQSYIISVEFDSYQYSQRVVIPDGKSFTYVHDIYCDQITSNCVTFTTYKEGEATPFEQTTYYLK